MKGPVSKLSKLLVLVGMTVAVVLAAVAAASLPAQASGRAPYLLPPRMGGPRLAPGPGSRVVHDGLPVGRQAMVPSGNGVTMATPPMRPSNRPWRTGWGGGPSMGFHGRWHHHRRGHEFFGYGFGSLAYGFDQPVYSPTYQSAEPAAEVDAPTVDPPAMVIERPILITTGCRVTMRRGRRVEVCHPTVQKF